ncbi:beta-N-acetylhexosaminidase [Thermogemmatispora carboxidivorans]|uniref:beta-N-acetylhexosaminidase n=1 Tax=Thermogemmatispora carboxidivorans TaxID=1382306 RepID=UPI00069CAA0B|nr:beta-N-acetylhexosaminidase [Thermogemmatispora carboxidivorans]
MPSHHSSPDARVEGAAPSATELRGQLGQLLMAGFEGTEPSPAILDLIENHRLGGVILFSRNIESAEQVYHLTSALQAKARAAGHRSPLLIAIDQENGMVQRLGEHVTLFPGNMALGASNSPELVTAVARATGRELRALGINMNLAPVLDINNNPANPVIGVRSFGEDPEQVARLGLAAVQGYREAGIMSCLKHFPGHGDTATDSHLALPLIPHDLARLERLELVPFARVLQEEGADCIMTAHIALPALTGAPERPATVAPPIISGLLRQGLRFDGVVMSDCLEMEAIAATLGVEQATVEAVEAGLDLILISHRYDRQLAGLAAMRSALDAGRLSPVRLYQALTRLQRLKARYLSWEQLPRPEGLRLLKQPEHLALQRQSYTQAITLLRNDAGLLPLRLAPEQQLLIVLPQKEGSSRVEDQRYPVEALIAAVRRYHPRTEARLLSLPLSEPASQSLREAVAQAQLVLLVTVNAYLDRAQSEYINWLVREAPCPVVALAVYSPYDLLVCPQLTTYLLTYEYTRPAIEAAVAVLFGDSPPQGRLPVSLPSLHARGEGLRC